MPPNATADSNARLNDTYDPLLNFSYYPSGSNFSTDFTGNNFYGGVGGLATDANNYASKDYRSGPSASWLQGDDFLGATGNNNLSSNYLNPETSTYIPNLSSVNLDQIKIGDQTMENVLKAFDSGSKPNDYSDINRALNGLNLDSSFTIKKYSNYDLDKKYNAGIYTDLETGASGHRSRFSSLDAHERPVNRSSIIKSHQSQSAAKGPVSFQPTAHYFTSPETSMAPVDASALLSDDYFTSRREESKLGKVGSFKKPSAATLQSERDQFLAFAAQQYRILASMNPDMMRAPASVEDLADRETFKYWARLLIEDRERQARIVLNLQKALTEALSSAAATGPNSLSHLGAATGDAELEDIGRFADQCRRRNQLIGDYFQRKRNTRFY